MYFVYYKDHTIDFTDRPTMGFDGVVRLAPGEMISTAKMLENLENYKNLCIISADPQKAFMNFASQFTLVDAAGGVVFNDRDQMLMIYRNNRWDLPKGYVEKGEPITDAAVREVMEETGLKNVERGEIIVTTYHFYPLGDKWIMKRTWWFWMSGNGDLIPQTEEGITRVEWIPVSQAQDYASQGFASVRQVLRFVRPDNDNAIKLENFIP